MVASSATTYNVTEVSVVLRLPLQLLPCLLLLLLLLLLPFLASEGQCAECSHCPVLSLFLSVSLLLPCSHFCLSAFSAPSRVSPNQFPLRTCSAACLAARQVLRCPLALRVCGPWSTRIHHAFCHHVMCLFDPWHLSCTELTSSSCPPRASTSLSCSVRSSSALISLSLLLSTGASCALSSSCVSCAPRPFAPPALSSLPHAPHVPSALAPPARSPPDKAPSLLAS